MYRPAPPRPKKTSIVRSRTGCKLCRQRRVKCDETKPSCGACTRAGKTCEEVSPSFSFNNQTASAHRPVSKPLQHVRWQPFYKSTLPPSSLGHEASRETRKLKQRIPLSVCNAQTHEDPDRVADELRRLASAESFLHIDTVIDFKSVESEQFYLNYWESSCIDALGRLFHGINSILHKDDALKHSLLALAACNVSRSSPEGLTNKGRLIILPNRTHQLSSQRYYSSAVGETARTLQAKAASSPLTTLAILVLFCFMETAMGNFRGFGWHCQGIAQIIDLQLSRLSKDALGKELIAAWLASRLHMWWRRMYFTTFALQLSQRSLSVSPELTQVLRTIDAQKTLLVSILCESHRLNTIATLQILSDTCAPSLAACTVDECISSLKAEGKKLDEWHSRLDPSQLPLDVLPQPPHGRFSEIAHPLFFRSYEAAINYAYYSAARIMQCTEMLYPILESDEDQETRPREDQAVTTSWMTILFRIVAGLDIIGCTRKNTYSIGIASLLLACVLKCDDLTCGWQVQNWLQKCVDLAILEEGSFPIAQTLGAVRIINEERVAGRDVYAIGLAEDDGGGSGKYSSYNSQRFRDFVILGRMRVDGSIYSKNIGMGSG
ncbi:hypothetical protein ASPACDRAFT_1859717 [Aspergillus aculeatus ATCC 16872]|uniref:Zn(2)-C6 fungal-type domain-containing protein n=1 Tax=Aspergillus aculeatus (strain ATCC 16872 / CBS 172.66 / WB 5094) TaxID=690307 RepID=A0A1L9WIC8_ASPA1|nr:uncharacterized protein ASPACDRAFT_1859717 [Aspergillus aculeatus ATCC 16872]OJJ95929.1 hypothetical protein ASPACDRAFT_1859717 [Aspergillus aculeatus ATCC 16872]